MSTLIKSLEDLKERAQAEDGCECFIVLAGGLVKSSKQIWYWADSNTFDVHEDIDGTDWEEVGLEVIANETNIIEALNNKSLYAY